MTAIQGKASVVEEPAGPHSGIGNFCIRHRVSINDLGIPAAMIAVLIYVCYASDIFVTEGQVTRAEQTIELDEVLLIGVVLSVGLLVSVSGSASPGGGALRAGIGV